MNAAPATRFLPEPANRSTVSNFALRKTDTEHVRSVLHLYIVTQAPARTNLNYRSRN